MERENAEAKAGQALRELQKARQEWANREERLNVARKQLEDQIKVR